MKKTIMAIALIISMIVFSSCNALDDSKAIKANSSTAIKAQETGSETSTIESTETTSPTLLL